MRKKNYKRDKCPDLIRDLKSMLNIKAMVIIIINGVFELSPKACELGELGSEKELILSRLLLEEPGRPKEACLHSE